MEENESHTDGNENASHTEGGTFNKPKFNKPKIIASIEKHRMGLLDDMQEMIEGVKTRDIPLSAVGDVICSIKEIDDSLEQLKRHPEEPERMQGIAIAIPRHP